MDGQWSVIWWWLAFGGTHIVGSSIPVRTRLIPKLGLLGFEGLYSLVALSTFVPLCYVYFTAKHLGPALFTVTDVHRTATFMTMLLSLVVIAQSLVTPSPLTTRAELMGKFTSRARGIQRITRHPQNFGFVLFGLAHVVSNPYVPAMLFFGGFVAYGLLSAVHQDRRTLAIGGEEVAQFQTETSLLPMAAILAGKQRFAFDEYNLPALVASIVLLLLLRCFHATLFGGFGA